MERVRYPIPDKMVKEKSIISVQFQAILNGRRYLWRAFASYKTGQKTPIAIADRNGATSANLAPQFRARATQETLELESSAPLQGNVTLKIYGMDGRLVKAEMLPAGNSTFSVGIASSEERRVHYAVNA